MRVTTFSFSSLVLRQRLVDTRKQSQGNSPFTRLLTSRLGIYNAAQERIKQHDARPCRRFPLVPDDTSILHGLSKTYSVLRHFAVFSTMNSQALGKCPKTLIVLDIGLSKPVAGKSINEIYHQGQILALEKDGGSPKQLAADSNFVTLPDGVVYSEQRQRLYFTNMGVPTLNDGSVCSIRLDGSQPEIVLAKGQVHTPKQLALDSVRNKLYICDREGLRVLRCNVDGSQLETLIQTGDLTKAGDAHDPTKWCIGIALSSRTGLFYWTQKGPSKGGKGRILCAPMDALGDRTPVCVLDNLPEPIDLDIDETSNILYWTDRGGLPYGNTFNRLQLDASGTRPAEVLSASVPGLKHEILVQNFDEAIGLAYDAEDRRWFISDMGGTIWAFDQDGGNKTKVFEDKERAFTGIAIARRTRKS